MITVNNKICVLSGRYPRSHFDSYINHRFYCNQNGYTYINCNWPTSEKNPYKNKLHYIAEYLRHFDYIFWIDDDAYFLNMDFKIQDIIPEDEKIMSICKSPSSKSITTPFSSGQFLLKNNELGTSMIEKALKQDMATVKAWWKEEYGYFTNGDQDILFYLFEVEDIYKDKMLLLDSNEFNSRPEDIYHERHQINLLHFTGKLSKKLKDYRRVKKQLKLKAGLLTEAQASTFELHSKGYLKRIKQQIDKYV